MTPTWIHQELRAAVVYGNTKMIRVRFVPVTGRTHQLRVHSAHERGLGVPIVGDPLYGAGTGPGQMKLQGQVGTGADRSPIPNSRRVNS